MRVCGWQLIKLTQTKFLLKGLQDRTRRKHGVEEDTHNFVYSIPHSVQMSNS